MSEELCKSNPICRRHCIRIKGSLASPLLVGCGEDFSTDADIIRDGNGQPFVPGSALAGALRQYFSKNAETEAVRYLFGGGGERPEDNRQSRLFVYDMELIDPILGSRHGVKLDEFKTAVDSAKYEVQIVEKGALYIIRLELIERYNDINQNERTDAIEQGKAEWGLPQIKELAAALNRGEIALGAKGSRGFGKLTVEEMKIKSFKMTNEKQYGKWLEWKWEDKEAFNHSGLTTPSDLKKYEQREHCLCVPLKVRTTILIRDDTSLDSLEQGNADFAQLQSNGNPVIPGTTWMGAIRGRIRDIIQNIISDDNADHVQELLEPVFGTWIKGKKETLIRASAVKVEESIIEGGHGLMMTRNAIDRFTGGTVDGALYTEIPWVFGQTDLVLRWPKEQRGADPIAICGLLLWAVSELEEGLLAVGGETAVGRGAFCSGGIVMLDGDAIEDRARYYQAAMEWCRNLKSEIERKES